jgi:hypothetical protein
MRLTLLARADQTGLGYQTRDYYKWLKPNKTVVIDLSILNGNAQNPDWYNAHFTIQGIPTEDDIQRILDDTDVLLTAETPYNLNLYAEARRRGIKTICVENPEFYDHMAYPNFDMPDLIILPSVWLQKTITDHAESRGTRVVQLHHPVDRDEYPYRERNRADFIHFTGKPAANDRNGTYTFMRACPGGIVTTQDKDLAWTLRRNYSYSTVYTDIQDNKRLYELGDIFVLPRKYGGNCLPLNEALSSGMPVIMPDIEPNDNILPREWLVAAQATDHFAPRFRVDIYETNVRALQDRLEWFRNADIAEQSRRANAIADTISWKTLLPRWQEAIASVL